MKLKLYEFLYFFDDGEQLVCPIEGNGRTISIKRLCEPLTVRELSKLNIWNKIADRYVFDACSANDVIFITLR